MVEAGRGGGRPGESPGWETARDQGWGGPKRPPHRSARLPHAQGEVLQNEQVGRSATLPLAAFPSTLPFTQFGIPLACGPGAAFCRGLRLGLGVCWILLLLLFINFFLIPGALTQCRSSGLGHCFGGRPGLPSPPRAFLGPGAVPAQQIPTPATLSASPRLSPLLPLFACRLLSSHQGDRCTLQRNRK